MIEVLDQIPLESINKHEFKHFVQKYIFNKKLDNIPEDIYYSSYLQKLSQTITLILEVDLNAVENITYQDSRKIKKLLQSS